MDYASFLLEAKRNLKSYEEAMLNKSYREAEEHALNTLAELRLLAILAKDAGQEK
jgi:hypothetical protein